MNKINKIYKINKNALNWAKKQGTVCPGELSMAGRDPHRVTMPNVQVDFKALFPVQTPLSSSKS